MDYQNKCLFFKYYFRSRQFLCLLLLIFYSLLFAFSYLFESERAVLRYVMLLLLLVSLIGFVFDFVKQYQTFRRAVLYGESIGPHWRTIRANKIKLINETNIFVWFFTFNPLQIVERVAITPIK